MTAPPPDVKASCPTDAAPGDADVEHAGRASGCSCRQVDSVAPAVIVTLPCVDDLAADGRRAADAGVDGDAAVGGVGERPRA